MQEYIGKHVKIITSNGEVVTGLCRDRHQNKEFADCVVIERDCSIDFIPDENIKYIYLAKPELKVVAGGRK